MTYIDKDVTEMRKLIDKTDPPWEEQETFISRLNPFKKEKKIPSVADAMRDMYITEHSIDEVQWREMQSFLSGYEAGRTDDNAKEAYKLWRASQDHDLGHTYKIWKGDI